MDSAPAFYLETFVDLEPLGGLSQQARTWARGRAWRSGPLAYDRKPAIKVAVTFEQHALLVKGLQRAVMAWGTIKSAIDGMWPSEFLLEGKTVADYEARDASDPATWLAPPICGWPEGMSVRLMEKFKVGLDASGLMTGTVEWLTAMHAAGKATKTYRKQVELGGRPFTYANLGMTGGVTVKIPAGAAHGAPVGFGGGLLDLGSFGKVKPVVEVGANATTCAYAEMAHWERSWHVRFVTTSTRETSGVKEHVARAPKKSGKAAVTQTTPAPPDRWWMVYEELYWSGTGPNGGPDMTKWSTNVPGESSLISKGYGFWENERRKNGLPLIRP